MTPRGRSMCGGCYGAGYLMDGSECPNCEGTGDRYGAGETLPVPADPWTAWHLAQGRAYANDESILTALDRHNARERQC